MYAAEQLFERITANDLYYTLSSLVEEDCYLKDFTNNQLAEDFLFMLEFYELAFVSSDKRVLLAPKGFCLLEYLIFNVDLIENNFKVKKQYGTKQPKHK